MNHDSIQLTRRPGLKAARRLGIAAAALVVAAACAMQSHAAVPANHTAPFITGATTTGGTVKAHTGVWTSGLAVRRFTFLAQWMICDGHGSACHAIAGAHGQRYRITSADAGNTLRVRITAYNGVRSQAVLSAASAKIVRG